MKNKANITIKKGGKSLSGNDKKNNCILVIDNYDSFTYNLVHAIKKISGLQVDVFRNDEIALEEIDRYERVVLSPGPGLPEEAGLLVELIRKYAPLKSLLGVCLGHQAIGEAFGAKLQNMNRMFHGIATPVTLTSSNSRLFEGLPPSFEVGRYHSWMIEKESLPDCFEVTSFDEEGRIMSMKHKQYDVEGVQFHPESVLTPLGEKMIANWLANTCLTETRAVKNEFLTQQDLTKPKNGAFKRPRVR